MFASKSDAGKKKLRLHVIGQEEPYQFSFTSPPAIAQAELERFKNLLASVVANNASATSSNANAATVTSTKDAPKLDASLSKTQTPRPTPRTPGPQSPSPYSRSSSIGVGSTKGGAYSSEVKQRVLTKHPELAELHATLIIAPGPQRLITEDEFWEGREVP